ncbi:hypothetical protein KXD96_26515 [Mycobacterium sp. SMC-2]|uniref:hypothetical protein n=1 Tax=Mycobacterium sp. SMC-2 TaxID=2857058 RepID=UPI0021B1BA7C|nr:hypothetical protein [Mycobacterium sp. SMC-2]UXA06361.1 hypothetical protein KXD96_26515 [Mycobacterium sp. SMC-2]
MQRHSEGPRHVGAAAIGANQTLRPVRFSSFLGAIGVLFAGYVYLTGKYRG